MLFFCFLSILIFLKLFSFAGLYVYSALAVIIGPGMLIEQRLRQLLLVEEELSWPWHWVDPVAFHVILDVDWSNLTEITVFLIF